MADYAGAVAAIKQRLIDNWTATPIAFLNEGDPVQGDIDERPAPWVLCEIVGTDSELRGVGTPGSHVWRYFGLVRMHVYVPAGSGAEIGLQHAVALGEIFRAATFYNATAGHEVRTLSPSIDGPDSGSDDGKWFRVTATVEFQYWHKG